MNLRETKGWSYGVRSGVSSNRDRIGFVISAPVQADRTGDSIRELQKEFHAFTSDKKVTPEELTRTINGNVRQLPGSFESSGAVMGGIQSIVNLGRSDDYYEKLADTYRGMDAAAIDAAAAKHLTANGMVLVVVGDAATVKPQLDALGIPVETVVPAGKP
jgi:predicted Zn-dependent peptidase